MPESTHTIKKDFWKPLHHALCLKGNMSRKRRPTAILDRKFLPLLYTALDTQEAQLLLWFWNDEMAGASRNWEVKSIPSLWTPRWYNKPGLLRPSLKWPKTLIKGNESPSCFWNLLLESFKRSEAELNTGLWGMRTPARQEVWSSPLNDLPRN